MLSALAANPGSHRRCPSLPSPRALFFLLQALLLLTCRGKVTADGSAPPPETPVLSEGELHKLIYQEPVEHLKILGNISDVEGSLVRTFLSPAHMRAASLIRRWMREAGMRTWMDHVGNVHGRVEGADPLAPALLIGSHYDTVFDAGRYDGALGIIVGIAAVKAVMLRSATARGIINRAQLGAALQDGADLDQILQLGQNRDLLASPVEVIAFCDEEGVRFQTTFLGSRAVVGSLVGEGLLGAADREGRSLADVLYMHGFDGSPAAVSRIAMRPESVKGYVEVHMEQGPVLESLGVPLGPVSAIAGQTRLHVSMHGVQGHAGTVPMRIRADPLAAAAESVAMIEKRCGGGAYPDAKQRPDFSEEDNLVCTVGALSLWPGASNVIPGSANFTIDVRCRSDEVRRPVVEDVKAQITAICARRGIRCAIDTKHDAPAVHCDPDIIDGMVAAAEDSRDLIERVLRSEGIHSPLHDNSPAGAQPVLSDDPDPPGSCQEGGGSALPGAACATNMVGLRSGGSPQPGDAAHAAGKGAGKEDVNSSAKGAAKGGGGKGGKSSALGRVSSSPGVQVLVSGAGHDALAMAELTKIGMMFVRCRGGVSHSPEEYVADEDVAAAVAALYVYLKRQLF